MAMYDTAPAPDMSAKEPGPGLWLSIIVLTIGTVAATWGGYAAFQSAFELLSTDSFEIPGSQTRDLDPGEYQIYTRDASVDIFDTSVNFDDVFVTLDQISVVNSGSGAPVPIAELYTTEALGRSANVYEATAAFEVVEAGRYTVTISSVGESRAVFGRSIESSLDRVVPWLVMAGVGLLLFLLGVALLIVGMVRRKRHRDRISTMPPMGAPAPGAPPPIPPTQVDVATVPPAPLVPPPIPPTAPSSTPGATPTTAPAQPRPPSPNTRQSESETPW